MRTHPDQREHQDPPGKLGLCLFSLYNPETLENTLKQCLDHQASAFASVIMPFMIMMMMIIISNSNNNALFLTLPPASFSLVFWDGGGSNLIASHRRPGEGSQHEQKPSENGNTSLPASG